MKLFIIDKSKITFRVIVSVILLIIFVFQTTFHKDITILMMINEQKAIEEMLASDADTLPASKENGEEGEETVPQNSEQDQVEVEKKYIKWVDFNVKYSMLEKALALDLSSYNTDTRFDWIETLSYLAATYGGNFSRYKEKDINTLVSKIKNGSSMDELTSNLKYYKYYKEAYTAILGEYVGTYRIQVPDKENPNMLVWQERRGLKVFSPIARGYSFNHYDDFGNQRSYGYSRKHLGHDIMGSVGTPITAIESGRVEVMGWNQYGGWRIGIRSFDGKRYYYYAHLRKDKPFHKDLYEGKAVKAGDIIGYMGMTGYSRKENVNNIKTPHLHLGIQLIFDESQKEGINQIWIDPYNIVKLLQKNRSLVYRDRTANEFYRRYDFMDLNLESYFN